MQFTRHSTTFIWIYILKWISKKKSNIHCCQHFCFAKLIDSACSTHKPIFRQGFVSWNAGIEIVVSKNEAEGLRPDRDPGLTLIVLRTFQQRWNTLFLFLMKETRFKSEIKSSRRRYRKKRFALRLRFAGMGDCLDLPPGVTVRCFQLSLPRIQEIEVLIKTATLESFNPLHWQLVRGP